ncbi:MAG: 4'-phosphopantetheinyl transferase superfamily protein, partial [Clostridia bacterium]|nr:4'-phosphopantetheinyl transferase superfamily protein [Clostridia bacterium]
MIEIIYSRITESPTEEDIKKQLKALPRRFYEKNHAYVEAILTRGRRASVYQSIVGLRLLSILTNREELPPLARNEFGRPFFDGAASPVFSISHTNGLVVCSIIRNNTSMIGVDCEKLYTKNPTLLAERFFAPCERKYIIRSDDTAMAFTEIWTKKEAYIKLLGKGLSVPLSSFDVMSDMHIGFETFIIDDVVVSVCTEREQFHV